MAEVFVSANENLHGRGHSFLFQGRYGIAPYSRTPEELRPLNRDEGCREGNGTGGILHEMRPEIRAASAMHFGISRRRQQCGRLEARVGVVYPTLVKWV